MPKAPITNITFGTMTLGYRGYGARVHDPATADAMLGAVLEFGHDQLDTRSVYGDGTCEQMLGDLRAAKRFGIATRIHSGSPPGSTALNTRGHEPENLKRVFKESLARLKTDKVKILYLVTPDSATPIESTPSAVQELHDEGLFEEFGVSNFSAWQVAEASEIAARDGWIRPSVYQGLYNAITRAVEPELFKCLGNYGIRFATFFNSNAGEPWKSVALLLPRRSLVSHLGFEPRGGHYRRNGTAAGRLLLDLIRNSEEGEGSTPSPADSYMRLAIYDLVGALFAPNDPVPSRHADKLFMRVRSVIKDGFADSDFGPCEAAARAGISLRYLQKMFTQRGSTCSEFIYSFRLDHAARLLQRRAALDARQALSEIAYASGFRDYR